MSLKSNVFSAWVTLFFDNYEFCWWMTSVYWVQIKDDNLWIVRSARTPYMGFKMIVGKILTNKDHFSIQISDILV